MMATLGSCAFESWPVCAKVAQAIPDASNRKKKAAFFTSESYFEAQLLQDLILVWGHSP
jgi:hypothetical protein